MAGLWSSPRALSPARPAPPRRAPGHARWSRQWAAAAGAAWVSRERGALFNARRGAALPLCPPAVGAVRWLRPLPGRSPRGRPVGLVLGGGTYVAFPSHLALSELDGASGSQHRGIEQLSLTKTQCGALPSALHPVVRHKRPVPPFTLPPARSPGCLANASLPPQCFPRDPRVLQTLPMGRRPGAAGPGRGSAGRLCSGLWTPVAEGRTELSTPLTAWGW